MEIWLQADGQAEPGKPVSGIPFLDSGRDKQSQASSELLAQYSMPTWIQIEISLMITYYIFMLPEAALTAGHTST